MAKDINFYCTADSDQILNELKTDLNGLSKTEAEIRLTTNGKNTIKQKKHIHLILQYFSGFKSPLILMLLFVALISYAIKEIIDGTIVIIMVFTSVTLNFWQEYKASNAAKKLIEQITNVTMVVREGKSFEVKNTDLCIGDIVEFNAGDLIPADCRIIKSDDFFINQSILTGESFPVEKSSLPLKLANNTPDLIDMSNILFSGTSVVSGTATAVIFRAGEETEFGKIAVKLNEQEEENQFTKGITSFSLMVSRVILFFVLFIFLVNTLESRNLMDSLFFSLAVAVGLTPEFLPMIMAVSMGKGSINMAKKGVIVKRLSAIPAFGSLDILCTDKTGTLTEDKIRLVRYTDVRGNNSDTVLNYAYLNSFFQTGINNPLDEAVINYKKLDINGITKIEEIPFDFNRRRISVVVENKDGLMMVTKGAPEEMFSVCKSYLSDGKNLKLNKNTENDIKKQFENLSSEGFRVLALATKNISIKKDNYTKDEETDLTLAGFIAFLDPPRADVKATLDELAKMGVEIKILTGDNELVAKKICNEAGVNIKGIMLGHEIHGVSDDQLKHKISDITIFARFSPDDKNKVVRLLREQGHIVGYMGDGINDAPAIKTADVGISVSNGVDVAKESADIILTEKTLEQLKDGVIEGRKIFGNTMKYIMMGISSNFGNMFSVLGATIFLPFLPMLPIQILLNNFLYDISQITIPTDNVDASFIQKPKRWDLSFIKQFMFIFGPISSIFDFTTFFVLYTIYSHSAAAFQTGWFMESLATQTLVIHVIRTKTIPFFKNKPSTPLILTTILVVVIGWLIPYSFAGSFFGFYKLSVITVLVLAAIVVLYLFSVEIGKKIFYGFIKE